MLNVDFIGVGPQRAGTTWLHKNLVRHPGICLPREPVKETRFFDLHYGRGVAWYEKHFDCRAGQRVGEIAPSYFDLPEVTAAVAAHYPAARIVVNVRNPVERAESLFLHELKRGRVPGDYDRAVEAMPRLLTSGHYRAHIERWEQHFGRERLHFVVMEDIKARPHDVLDGVCRFLDVAPFEASDLIQEAVNEAFVPKHPWVYQTKRALFQAVRKRHLYGVLALGQQARRLAPAWLLGGVDKDERPSLSLDQKRRLFEDYRDDIAFLEERLGRSFPNWRPA